jgi:hypothetical protein
VVDGDIYPEKELPGKKTKRPCLRWWTNKIEEDLFSDEENELNDKMIKEGGENTKENVPWKSETLNYDKKKKTSSESKTIK